MIYTLLFLLGMLPLALQAQEEPPPQYLYKILSLEDWTQSKDKPDVKLPVADQSFVHLAKEDQVSQIIAKYWKDAPEVVLLKLDRSQLSGRLVLEANPGGTNKYYHLYMGAIPHRAVVEARIIHRDEDGGYVCY